MRWGSKFKCIDHTREFIIYYVFIITSEPGMDLRDSLARQIVDGGYALRELRGLDMTLEDIFLRLTTEEVNA